jgi:hypothetical protein
MISSPSNSSIEEKLRAATRMPQPRPEFLTGLRLRLATEPAYSPTNPSRLRLAFGRKSSLAACAALILLLAGFVALGPQRVIAAVQELIGYIPGIGFVENAETVRVLAESVSISRDGVTMSVEDAVVDAESTRIILRVEGYTNARQLFFQPDSTTPAGPRQLLLPNGAEMSLQSWSVRVDASSLNFLLYFSPLPENALDARLIFDQIPSAQQGWQIPLHFERGQIHGRILEAMPVTLSSSEQQGITMVLESVAQTPGMDALRVKLKTNDASTSLGPNWANSLKLEDQNGKALLLSVMSTLDQDGFNTAVLQTPILVPGERYTLRLQGPIELFKYLPAKDTSSRFSLYLGTNPQPGQSWSLDQTIVAAGQTFHLSGVHLLSGNACSSSNPGDGAAASLVFDFDPHPGTTNLMVAPLDSLSETRIYEECVAYQDAPLRHTEFKISSFSLMVDGSWEIYWQVPAQ